MTWNYQVVEHHEPGMPVWYGLHEVYRCKEGSSEITGVTLEPDAVGDSYDEVVQTLARMLSDAIQRPLVVDSDGAHTERVGSTALKLLALVRGELVGTDAKGSPVGDE